MAESAVLRVIRRIADDHRDKHASDRELLTRFVEKRDEDAFAALVARHGSMVMGVGLRVLRHHQDAEDVCQATFLLLAKKANTMAWRDSVANWLYEVAYHLSLKARDAAARRSAHEGKVQPKTPPDPLADISARDLQGILDEELRRLAKKYRTPLILCCLEGKTRDEAARFLGVPLSTVISRLVEGREVLRRRLAKRGVPLSLALAGMTLLSETVRAAVPATLVRATSRVALQVLAGKAITNLVSANVFSLVKGGMQTMFVIKLKVAMAALLFAGLVVSAALISGLNGPQESALAAQPAAQNKDKPPVGSGPAAEQDVVKVVKPGADYVRSLAYCNDRKSVTLVLWKEQDPRTPGSVVLWDVQKAKVEHTLQKFDKDSRLQFFDVCSSKDGSMIAASTSKMGKVGYGAFKVWEAKTGKLVRTFELDAQVRGFALSADGKKLVGGGVFGDAFPPNGKMFVWDVKTGEVLQTLEAEAMMYYSAAVSEDGKWIAGAGYVQIGNGIDEKAVEKGKVIVWEVETGKVKHEWSDLAIMSVVVFSPDGTQVAAGAPNDRAIRIWDMQTGKLKHKLKPQGEGGIHTALAFSPDGKTLASAGVRDARIFLWDVAKENVQATLEEHIGCVLGVAFSPDGRTLVSGGNDGTMRFWPVAPGQPKK